MDSFLLYRLQLLPLPGPQLGGWVSDAPGSIFPSEVSLFETGDGALGPLFFVGEGVGKMSLSLLDLSRGLTSLLKALSKPRVCLGTSVVVEGVYCDSTFSGQGTGDSRKFVILTCAIAYSSETAEFLLPQSCQFPFQSSPTGSIDWSDLPHRQCLPPLLRTRNGGA